MSIYTSRGTISVHCHLKNGCPKTKIFFVPDNDYSIKHGNKTFAVFVPQSCDCKQKYCNCKPQTCDCKQKCCNCNPQTCGQALIRKYDGDKGCGVKIHVGNPDCTKLICGAALHQKKVQVWVKQWKEGDEILKYAECYTKHLSKKTEEAKNKAEEAEAGKISAEKAIEGAKCDKGKAAEAKNKVEKAEAAKIAAEKAITKLAATVCKSKHCSKLWLTGITAPVK